jgi:ribosomal-protein-serine acetyltransferase
MPSITLTFLAVDSAASRLHHIDDTGPMRLSITRSSHLRLLDERDGTELHALIDANRAHLSRWMPWAAEQSSADTVAFIQKAKKQLAENAGFQAAVIYEDSIIGVAGYHGVDWSNRSTSIGYWLAEAHQGKGTMTRAVRVLTEHALSAWELNRIEIRAAVENSRSRAIPERLGFHREGTLREAERVGGRYLDLALYAMLATDGPAKKPA